MAKADDYTVTMREDGERVPIFVVWADIDANRVGVDVVNSISASLHDHVAGIVRREVRDLFPLRGEE